MEHRTRPYDRLVERAALQHGFLRQADLDDLAVTQVYLRKLTAAGRAEHRGRGLYRLTALPITAHTEYQEAVLWAGGNAAIGGEAALAVWDLADVNPRRIEVIVPPGHRVRRKDKYRFTVVAARLGDADIDLVDGIPVVVAKVAIRQAIDGGVEGTLIDQAIATATTKGLLQPLAEARLRVAVADRHANPPARKIVRS
ncbi:MAG: hypothetical protein M3137_21200 [Actinomycetota bacterium]|nr:hypothetical protein [Actinomycetota bacterium]